jgi:hypothetical protein
MALSVLCSSGSSAMNWRAAPAGPAQIRLAFSRQQRLGSGQRQLRRAAVHLRHAGFVGHRPRHRRAHQHRHRGLSHRTRAALVAPAAHHVHRIARRRAQRHSRPVGNFCDGAVAARHLFPCCKNTLVSCRCFKARLRPVHAGRRHHPRHHDHVPIITSVSREILRSVPGLQREAAYALGATRWEVTRIAVLSYAKKGIVRRGHPRDWAARWAKRWP